MLKKPFVILMVSLLLVGGLLLTQGTTVAFSRPLLGFTVTPVEPTVAPPTAVPPAATPVPTGEPEEPEVVLPVTGEEFISAANVCYSPQAGSPVRFVNLPARIAYIPQDEPSFSDPTGEVTRIVIPSLAVDARVEMAGFTGTSWSVKNLGQNVGWLQNTSLPGLGGNTVLAGHVSLMYGALGPFHGLAYLKPGAKVYLYTDDNRMFVYQMRERYYVRPNDISVTLETQKPQLTMLTCSHWNQDKKEYQKRMAIVADLVSYKDLGSK